MSSVEEALPGSAGDDAAALVPVRRLLTMAVVAAVLAVVALVTVLPRFAPPAPTQGGERVFRFDPKRVRGVEMLMRDRPVPYSFVRKDATWTLQSPRGSVEVPSDRLDGFLETLAGLTRLVVIDAPGTNPKDFGLLPPRAVISIRDGHGFSFAIGDRNPPLTALYVQVLPSTNIEMVGSILLWEYDKLVALTKTLPVEQRERTDAAEMR